MKAIGVTRWPPAWGVLEEAIRVKSPVRAGYHGHERVLCPHALGWKSGRPKALSYQAAGTTSEGPLPVEAEQCWRSMFVDEIEDGRLTDGPWRTADNHSTNSNCFDYIEKQVDS